MSIRLMSEVWRTDLPTVEKMVLLVIADHANDEGTEAWPSQATIAIKASVSIRTVQRAVNSLVAARYLTVAKHAGGSATCREDRRPHRYTMNLKTLREAAGNYKKQRGDAPTTREVRGDSGDDNGATFTPDTGRLSRPKNHTNKPPLEPPGDFDVFWKEYPLKVGKQAARKAFEKALQSATLEEILIGVKNYAKDPNRHPSYTAHPSTWLNAGRWADEPLPPRELTPEEKRKAELEIAKKRAEQEKIASQRWFEELREQKAKAVPMPEGFRDLFRKSD